MTRRVGLFAKRSDGAKQAPAARMPEPRSRLVSSLRLYRLVEQWDRSDNYYPYRYWVRAVTDQRSEAELVGSRYLHNDQHMLLLDLDGKVTVVDTGDPDRHVVIVHANMSWRRQKKVLVALAQAGLMGQSAVTAAFKDREVIAELGFAKYTSHKRDRRYNLLLDLNVPVEVHESKTPGHHHLIAGANMTWFQYRNVLKALASAGVIERKWVRAALRDKQTFLSAKGKI